MLVVAFRLTYILIPALLFRGETDMINKQDKRDRKKNQYEAKISQEAILKLGL